ncbi:hypothetical protein [Acinetobacter johnsonii]|uniref:hypothetical protein n=1 Tax=Acinetobacter johnsonii TaxID=40214 RepID=UPI00301648D4
MILKGNNAEKIATTLIIFIILFLIYSLVCAALNKITGSSLDNLVKDGMGFAVSGVAPVVAILLFNDWRNEHIAVDNRNASIRIKELIKELKNSLDLYESRLQSEESFIEYRKWYFSTLLQLTKQIEHITNCDEKAFIFLNNTKKIDDLLFSCGTIFISIYSLNQRREIGDPFVDPQMVATDKGLLQQNIASLNTLIGEMKVLSLE